MLEDLGVSVEVSGRVQEISVRRSILRVRSQAVGAGCHWLDEHVLCGGSQCAACDRGHPRRPFFFIAVDSPKSECKILRLTPRDLAEIGRRAYEAIGKNDVDSGLQFAAWRERARVPMTIEYLGHTRGLVELSQEMVWLDVLRIHRIMARPLDLRNGGALTLIRDRIAEKMHRVSTVSR